MPLYEVAVLVRSLSRVELAGVARRAGAALLERGGVLRAVECLGPESALPYRTSAHGLVHRTATRLLYRTDLPAGAVPDLLEEFSRDVDIVRTRLYHAPAPDSASPPAACTLHDELLPPAYRREVQQMISIGKKQKFGHPFTYEFKYNSGLDYYPFQK